MLVFSRERDDRVVITHQPSGDQMEVVIVRGVGVRIGFDGPQEFVIHRREVQERVDMERLATSGGDSDTGHA